MLSLSFFTCVQCFEPLQTCIEIVTPTETSKRVSFRVCAHFLFTNQWLVCGPLWKSIEPSDEFSANLHHTGGIRWA